MLEGQKVMEDPSYNRRWSLLSVCFLRQLAALSLSFAVVGCASESVPSPASGSSSSAVLAQQTAQSDAPILSGQMSGQMSGQSDPLDASAPPAKPEPILPRPLPLPPSTEPVVAIRIEILQPSESVVIDHPSGSIHLSPEHPSPSEFECVAKTPVTIQSSADGWRITSARDGNRPSQSRDFSAGELTVCAVANDSKPLSFNGVNWPGKMRIIRTATSIDLVMDVPMESYLPGVIAKELYPSWCQAAYNAQAIAARSFAVVEEARWQGRRHYDMVAGQQSQAWVGSTDNAKAIAAVRETRGQVLMHDGLVVPAYYSSACGGRPANAFGVLTDNSYHDIAPVSTGDNSAQRTGCCEHSKVATWKLSIPLAQVQARLQRWGGTNRRADLAALRTPSSITVEEKHASGRPKFFRITTANGGSVTMEAEDFRRAMNAAGDAKTNLKSCDCHIQIRAGAAEFSGRGFGHGVGLCQHGAQAMGAKGSSFGQILARYYPDTMIVKAWK